MAEETGARDRAARTAFRIGLVLLAFLTGVWVTEFRLFPYELLFEDAFTTMRAMKKRRAISASPKNSVAWTADPEGRSGVTRHDPDRSFGGYTLVVEPIDTSARLIEMNGDVVHEWSLPFSEAFPQVPHVKNPVPEEAIFWARAQMMPDGDLIVVYNTELDTPYGYGMARIDKDSKLIWAFADRVHHRFDVRPDGTLWALTHRIRDLAEEPVPGRTAGRVLDDDVVHISAEGEELWRVSLLEAVAESGYADALFFRLPAHWDWLHTNTVKEVPEEWAAHHGWAKPGQLLLSIRSLDALALLDRDSKRISWATRGFWVGQHDPDFLSQGRLMIFDNVGYGGPTGASRVASFNPDSGGIEWSYVGTSEDPLDSDWGSAQQLLPNGNVMIIEAGNGRVFEVTPGGDIVWEYFSTGKREFKGENYRPSFGAVERHAIEDVTFLD